MTDTSREPAVLAAKKVMSRHVEHYYPDDTAVPPLPLERPAPRTTRWSTQRWLATAAVITAMGTATYAAAHLTSNDQVQVDVAGPTPTTAAPANPTAAPANTPPTIALPAHMKAEHDGPAMVHNYPVNCPDSSRPNEEILSDRPVSPVALCQERGLMGNRNPDHVHAAVRRGTLYLDAEPSKDVLPDGFTFTASDYEMSVALPEYHAPDGKCIPFDEVKKDTVAVTQRVAGSTWVVKENPPTVKPHPAMKCHYAQADLKSRTVMVYRVPGGDDAYEDIEKKYLAVRKKLHTITEAVNSQCLSVADAMKLANATAARLGEADGTRNLVKQVIPTHNQCARIYQYPAGNLVFIMFGQKT